MKKNRLGIQGIGGPRDWPAIHQRLARIQTALESGLILDRETQRTILRERAKKWAQEQRPMSGEEDDLEVVEFSLAYETYAIETSYIREVYPMREYTPLPGTPPFVLGIVNVRGRIVSVIDIKKFFELPEKGLTDLNQVIILQNKRMEFGILADVILGIYKVPKGTVQTTLPTLIGIRADYLRGVTHERIVILDAEQLLTDQKILIHDEGNIGSSSS